MKRLKTKPETHFENEIRLETKVEAAKRKLIKIQELWRNACSLS